MKVVITGALGQLGKDFTKILTNEGCKVIQVDKNSSNNQDVQSFDITSHDAVIDFWKNHSDAVCLINNAGVGIFSPLEERTVEELNYVLNVNIIGNILMTKEFISSTINSSDVKHVINIASIYGHISSDYRIYGKSGRNNSEIYSASKAGVIALTKYFAANYAHKNYRFNSISPGGVQRNQSNDFIKNYSDRNPMNRLANGNEIAKVIKFLVMESPDYMNGEDLKVDGGHSAW
jgi:NAD(P)-dependent dehydrogenase (short-subunit alcohol dehydrogenase family)